MKIKADKMCELEKFRFIEYIDYFIKQVTKQREIKIFKIGREIRDYMLDPTTYTGYKYEGEYRHIIKPYIQDLIKADMVEE